MARLWINGFEWQSVTNGVEWATTNQAGTGGVVAINTTTVRSGAASLRVVGAPDDSNYIEHTYAAANSVTYLRFYIRVVSRPTDATGAICELVASGGSVCASIGINTSGQLQLFDGNIAGTQRGSNSTALSLNTWYGVELKIENGAGTEIEARLWEDGVGSPTVFASGAMTVASNANLLHLGMVDFVTSFEAFFDDVAIDSAAYPGESKIVVAVPNAAGDTAATTGNASMIAEIPPSNTATSGSTMIELDSNGVIGDYNITDTATLGIGASDTIKCIQVLARIREEAAGTSSYQLGIKSASGGASTTTAAADAGNATARTNPNGTTAFGRMLLSETDPTTGVAWTPTGTNSLENAHIFLSNVDADSTPDLWGLTMAAMIEYTPAAAPGGETIKDIIGLGVVPFAR